jgi:CRISPR-associated protein (TIGR03986 family)
MNTITAPYGFVPLSDKVVLPDWLKLRDQAAPPVHDVPFEDGLCGTLELEIVAETPIFIRGTDEKGEQPFRLSDGRYAIPGTALRGSLRNIVEIITFSRFNRVNDHRYAVRDLKNRHLYGQYMADIVKDPRTGKGEPMPLVNAGWLKRNESDQEARYEIEVCDFAKLEYRSLMELADKRGVRGFRPGEQQGAVDKYRVWGSASLEVETQVGWKNRDSVGPSKVPSRYGVAKAVQGPERGTIVMTGQPSRWVPDQDGSRARKGQPKHHDFVFFTKKTPMTLEVSPKVFEDFEFAHSDRGQQNRLGKSQTPNVEWGFWEEKLRERKRIPIFFLLDPQSSAPKVKSFGLAMMFRLSYAHSIGQAISNVSPIHLEGDGRLDFAEGVFGTVREDKSRTRRDGAVALKGRVGISHAFALGNVRPGKSETAVLGAPKASYYPNYVEQAPGTYGGQPSRDAKDKPVYQTWMDGTGAPRGWKRYRALTCVEIPEPPSGADGRPLDLAKVGTTFAPLPAGTTFAAHVDVHNLRPQELGALLWAIELGGDLNARHTLGMARPLGFGRCRISIRQSDVRGMTGESVELASCRERFEIWMEGQIAGWKSSAQIRELLALSQPVAPENARYQRLDPGKRVNEFSKAKEEGLALPSAAKHGVRAVTGLRISGATSNSTRMEVGATLPGRTLTKTTKKGGPMFEILGQEAVLHPASQVPSSLAEGEQHTFAIMATGKPLLVKWVDPNAPPPEPPKKPSKGGPKGKPGFRR